MVNASWRVFRKRDLRGEVSLTIIFRLYFSQNLKGLIFIEKRKAALMDTFWSQVCVVPCFSINIKNLCFFYPAHSPRQSSPAYA